jgi:hypothetical protein
MTNLTVTIPAHLVQPLAGLIDAGLRATGIRAAKEAAELITIIEKAANAAQDTETN